MNHRPQRLQGVLVAVFSSACAATTAQTVAPSAKGVAGPAGVETGQESPAPKPAPRNYYVDARSTGTKRESEPPRYVRNLGKTEWFKGEGLEWLDVGLDYRVRYEYRDDDVRRPVATLDEPLLLRTRAYLGVHERFDPLRGYIEFEDARAVNGEFPEDDRDFNRNEIIQAVAELYFEDALGVDRPLRVQGGRMAFEYTDRRLLARNEWRNTTNNFQGFRGILGQPSNDWQVDVLAMKPVKRDTDELDAAETNRWFYGVIGDWRRWSEVVTLQPYYYLSKQQELGSAVEREIHTLGLRGYGNIAKSGYDYDLQGIGQWGESGADDHEAWAATAELGYTFQHAWKPRLGGFVGYASGDRQPGDGENNRFDRLFGFARPWSSNDYITFDNVIAPKTRLEFQPSATVRVDLGWSWYWLASETDRWGGANLRDPNGDSGDFMGHEFDARARFKVGERCDLTLGYAHFWPGEFTRNVGRDEDTDFFYIEFSPRLFP
jgi:hypothetical protein